MVTKARPRRVVVQHLATHSQRFVIPLLVGATSDGRLTVSLNTALVADERHRSQLGEVLWLQPAAPDSLVVSHDDVIDALMASSAHPSSFGPIVLGYCALETDCPSRYRAPAGDDRCRQLAGKLDDAAAGSGATRKVVACREPFVDGGTFDNVPLGVAMAQAESVEFPQGGAGGPPALPVRYIYMDPSLRREVASTDQCSDPLEPALSDHQLVRDPIRELVTFAGGMFQSATDYELHNVLRYNDWNETTRSLVKRTELLLEDGCRTGKMAKPCGAALGELEETFQRQSQVVAARERSGDAPNWQEAWSTLLGRLHDALAAVPDDAGDVSVLRSLLGRLRASPSSARILQTPTRLAPIAGAMLAHFAAFVDRPFRDYDYYSGVYDGLYSIASWDCEGCAWEERARRIEGWKERLHLSESDEALAVFKRLFATEGDLSNTVRPGECPTGPPVVRKPERTCPTTPSTEAPSTVVMNALLAPGRCQTDRGYCLNDANFDGFLEELRCTGYVGTTPLARRAVDAHDWWSEPGVLLSDRLERLEEQRKDQPGLATPIRLVRTLASVESYHQYRLTHDPWWYAPPSDAPGSLRRLVSPSVGGSTDHQRFMYAELLHYALRFHAFRLGVDASVNLGIRSPATAEEANDYGLFSRRRIVSFDILGGPRWQTGSIGLSSLQLRGGGTVGSIGAEVSHRLAFELGANFLLDFFRLGVGCRTDGHDTAATCSHDVYAVIGVNDILGLLYGIF
jgi:hypothetical protein